MDYCRALPPVIESRTRSKATNGNTLVANEEEWVKPAKKKQRRTQRDLQKQVLQRDEESPARRTSEGAMWHPESSSPILETTL
jgi:hypothetical protein